MLTKIQALAAFDQAVDQAGAARAALAQVRQDLEQRLARLVGRGAIKSERRDFGRWFQTHRPSRGVWGSQRRLHLWQASRLMAVWFDSDGQWSEPIELRRGPGRTQELMAELLAAQEGVVYFERGTPRARSARRLMSLLPGAFRRERYRNGQAGRPGYHLSLVFPVVRHQDHRQPTE